MPDFYAFVDEFAEWRKRWGNGSTRTVDILADARKWAPYGVDVSDPPPLESDLWVRRMKAWPQSLRDFVNENIAKFSRLRVGTPRTRAYNAYLAYRSCVEGRRRKAPVIEGSVLPGVSDGKSA
jgi:hypothetical protein